MTTKSNAPRPRGPINDWRYVAAGMLAVLPVVLAIVIIKFWGG